MARPIIIGSDTMLKKTIIAILGVLSNAIRRASQCRASSGDINSIDTEKPRLASSTRQVHPVCEDKAQLLAYDKHPNVDPAPKRPSIDLNASPPPYPKRASLDSNPSPTSYPLTPNIIVEAGRIEFVKPTLDGSSFESTPTPPTTPRIGGRITVTRGQQTSDDEDGFDDVKEKLEARVLEMEAALEAAQKSDLKDKQTLAKLQRQLSRCTGVEGDDDFVAEEFAPEPADYVPLSYKERAVAIAAAHPKWSLKSLQSHGCSRLKHKSTLYRWRDDIKRGGTHFDKWKAVDRETYEQFTEARQKLEQVTTRTLQQWAMNAAFPFLSDNFKFVASSAWVERFKRNHSIRQRKITKFVSYKELATMDEVLAAGEEFRTQTKLLIMDHDLDYVINTDQTGCQYQSTYEDHSRRKGRKPYLCEKRI